jgi:hypothetical protein
MGDIILRDIIIEGDAGCRTKGTGIHIVEATTIDGGIGTATNRS